MEQEDPSFQAERTRLSEDLTVEPMEAISKNFASFELRCKIREEQITELKDAMVHQGDRVISTLLCGPHEKIIDPVRAMCKLKG